MQELENPDVLEARLGYTYCRKDIRDLALTHPSAYGRGEVNTDYERLEFLGDAVLELTVTEYLFHNLPKAPEGLMTQLRARVVGRPNLAAAARKLELNKFMILGKGEDISGGRDRDSNLSNTFEALLGAIFLDSDFETAKAITLALLQESLDSVTLDPREINPKGELQMELQKLYPESPTYVCTEHPEAGMGDTRFSVTVLWRGITLGHGQGNSKRRAEVQAASEALEKRSWLTPAP